MTDPAPTILRANRVLLEGGAADWDALIAETEARLGPAARDTSRRRVFVAGSMRAALGCVACGLARGLDFGVIEAARMGPEVAARLARHGILPVDAETGEAIAANAPPDTDPDPDPAPPPRPGRVAVLTSGTTGLLKVIDHAAGTLNTFDRLADPAPNAWFLPYQIGSYAWYQMVCLGLFVPGQALVPGDPADLAASFEAALAAGRVTAVSSTPTFWRHALMRVDPDLLRAAPLAAVSLGGEIVDQAILDRLAALYPAARLRHIYASSEAGAAIVVGDGRAGFPAAMAGREDARIGIRVEGGRLHVRSPYANRADAGGWIDTGDLVERQGDRYHFRGRADGAMINVGGQKAFSAEIEAHLARHPSVLWARVGPRRAPLMGELPAARVVLSGPMDEDAAEAMLTAHCAGALADHAVPRIWEFLPAIPMRGSLKS